MKPTRKAGNTFMCSASGTPLLQSSLLLHKRSYSGVPLVSVFDQNRKWVTTQLQKDPAFFSDLAKQHCPEFLWIGCSDSQVAPNVAAGMPHGSFFVHRNLANLVVPTDMNFVSTLHYALEVLAVRHIIVCGHYGCGAIRSVLAKNPQTGLASDWLQPVKALYPHVKEIGTGQQEEDLLVELNVKKQLENLAQLEIVQKIWKKQNTSQKFPILHGWVLHSETGTLSSLFKL